MRSGQRTIKVQKQELIKTLKNNKENHIKEYSEAIKAYKLEALEQLSELTKQAKKGEIGLQLKLIEPVDNADNYDKIISMFEWEVEDIVELTQDEFKEYVLDETSFSQHAKISNMMYSHKWL